MTKNFDELIKSYLKEKGYEKSLKIFEEEKKHVLIINKISKKTQIYQIFQQP
jgi:hypothetical protein